MTQKRALTANEKTLLTKLANLGKPVRAPEIQIEGLRSVHVGKVAHNLQRLGLTQSTKDKYVHVWSITDLGLEAVQDLDNGTTPDLSRPTSPISRKKPVRKVSISGTGMAPVDPQNLVYVVSEGRLAEILSAHLGLGSDEMKLLRARVRTLEATITENAKMIDRLKREREAALDLAEQAEERMKQMKALRDQMDKI